MRVLIALVFFVAFINAQNPLQCAQCILQSSTCFTSASVNVSNICNCLNIVTSCLTSSQCGDIAASIKDMCPTYGTTCATKTVSFTCGDQTYTWKAPSTAEIEALLTKNRAYYQSQIQAAIANVDGLNLETTIRDALGNIKVPFSVNIDISVKSLETFCNELKQQWSAVFNELPLDRITCKFSQTGKRASQTYSGELNVQNSAGAIVTSVFVVLAALFVFVF
eukprot:TRINITY_DN12397_c0_g1_i1.p1 TRINITY_DN12397_c0_g1~~TRINITY_DN12397_c0_g1_i1.p1  ORF type:complete len:222 (+),score=45.86 TRINITY_DN12397_c0_g1_i1:57-722(+)